MGEARAEAMLSGPRGRRFCMAVANSCRDEVGSAFFEAARSPADRTRVDRLAGLLTTLTAAEVAAATGERALLRSLGDAVDFARYWEEPDEEDVLLTDHALAAALRPVAASIRAAPGFRWWSAPFSPRDQSYVRWTGEHPTEPPRLTGAARALREWRASTVAGERRARSLPEDPAANCSGEWWSAPVLHGLVLTTRAHGWLGATRLMCAEDAMDWERAEVWPLRPSGDCRVYEISGPESWVALVDRYPLSVSRSRRHDWWRATGRAGEWYIPDWAAVAADYDAVHLSPLAYVTTAGRAWETAGGATVLAGWDPAATYWLTDVLEQAGPPAVWHLREGEGDEPDVWETAGD